MGESGHHGDLNNFRTIAGFGLCGQASPLPPSCTITRDVTAIRLWLRWSRICSRRLRPVRRLKWQFARA